MTPNDLTSLRRGKSTLDFVEKICSEQYRFELEQKDKITGASQIPLGLLPVAYGALAFIYARLPTLADSPTGGVAAGVWITLAYVAYGMAAICFGWASYAGFRILTLLRYKYLPPAEAFLEGSEQIAAFFWKKNIDAELRTLNFLQANASIRFADAATFNRAMNETRLEFKGSLVLFVFLGFLFLLSVFILTVAGGYVEQTLLT